MWRLGVIFETIFLDRDIWDILTLNLVTAALYGLWSDVMLQDFSKTMCQTIQGQLNVIWLVGFVI